MYFLFQCQTPGILYDVLYVVQYCVYVLSPDTWLLISGKQYIGQYVEQCLKALWKEYTAESMNQNNTGYKILSCVVHIVTL